MKNKKILAALLAVVVVLGSGFGISRLLNHSKDGGSSAVPVIEVSSLGKPEAAVTNRFTGMVETQKKKTIQLDPEKTVKEVLVSEGAHVKEGDVLFKYDTEKTELEISQKELGKEKLKISIENYKDQIAQLQNQLNQGNLSSADRMTTNAQIMEHQTAMAQAEYDLKVADSEIVGLKASVKNCSVKSPMSGTVEELQDPGAMTDPSAAFMTITADGDYRIKGKLSEQSIGMVYEGLEMLVRSRVDDTQVWKGTVTAIESRENKEEDTAMNSNGSADGASTYSFYVTLESMDGLMLGQHVTLEPDLGEMEGLVIPTGYIVYDEDGKNYVFAVTHPGDKLEKRPVEMGESYDQQGMVQILSGLSESDYVAWPDNEECVVGAATKGNAFSATDETKGASAEDKEAEDKAE